MLYLTCVFCVVECLLIVYLICIYLIGPNSIHHRILCRQLDRDNLGVIKRYQFKELLEARFKMKVTDDELTSVLRPLLEDTNHSLIPYARFLELFSSPRCSMFFFPLIVSEKQTGCQVVSTHSSFVRAWCTSLSHGLSDTSSVRFIRRK